MGRGEKGRTLFFSAWSWEGASWKKGVRPWAGGTGGSKCEDLGGEAQLRTERDTVRCETVTAGNVCAGS